MICITKSFVIYPCGAFISQTLVKFSVLGPTGPQTVQGWGVPTPHPCTDWS